MHIAKILLKCFKISSSDWLKDLWIPRPDLIFTT